MRQSEVRIGKGSCLGFACICLSFMSPYRVFIEFLCYSIPREKTNTEIIWNLQRVQHHAIRVMFGFAG